MTTVFLFRCVKCRPIEQWIWLGEEPVAPLCKCGRPMRLVALPTTGLIVEGEVVAAAVPDDERSYT